MLDEDGMSYVISDINQFVEQTRKIVFSAFGQPDINENSVDNFINQLYEVNQEEMDASLSQEECLAIVHSHVKPRKTKSGKLRYIVEDKVFNKIIEDFNSRLVSNILKQLVSKGLIESAFDEEANDFVFWVKDDNEEGNKKT